MPRSNVIGRIKYFLRVLNVKLNYICEGVTYHELYNYVTGGTPTGDAVDFNSIIRNEYYFIHEIIEICELKNHGIIISRETVTKFYPEVYEAHIEALDKELRYALIKNDFEWVEDRVATAYKQIEVDEEILSKYIDGEKANMLMKMMHSVLAKYYPISKG